MARGQGSANPACASTRSPGPGFAGPVEGLIEAYAGHIVSFASLPREAQAAYLACMDGDSRWATLQPGKRGDLPVGYIAALPLALLADEVWAASDETGLHADFASFHAQYQAEANAYEMARASHPDWEARGPGSSTEIWPVMLDRVHGEIIEDGWHRFHHYLDAGHETITAFYHPRPDELPDGLDDAQAAFVVALNT